MPELPEVETLRLQLSQLITGKTIKSIDILKSKSFIGDKRQVISGKIVGVRRFAKILVIDLSGRLSLAIHLKMSGQLIYKRKAKSEKRKVKEGNKHTRVIINFADGDKLFFNDQRMFGWIRVVQNKKHIVKIKKSNIQKLDDLIRNLGPDPLRDLSLEKFQKILKTSRKPIKLLLMDQQKLAGVGNIYANDALFLAGIRPNRKASELSSNQAIKLHHSLLRVLRDGIKWRGASKHHFRDVFGAKGKVQEHFYVYDREGKECINKCGEKIKKIRLGGRGTFFCPACQR